MTETLSDKMWDESGKGDTLLNGKDVKEKIQNAQRRIEEEIESQYIPPEPTLLRIKINEIIDKIFKEEFGEKLI